jgi:hypothetical protein
MKVSSSAGESNTANVPFQLGATVPITAAATSAMTGVNPALRNPLMQRWNAAVEQQVGANTSITAAYAGSRGSDFFGQAAVNGFGGVPQNLRPDIRFSTQTLVDNMGDARYHSLQVFAHRRFSRSIDFTAAYTFARATDTTSREAFGTVPVLINRGASAAPGFQGGGSQFAPRPLQADWGRSEFDVPHNFTFSHLIELPFGRGRQWLENASGILNQVISGWSLTGMAVIRSGEPVNLTRGIDYNDDGDIGSDRPQLLSGSLGDLYPSEGDKTQHFISQTDALLRLNTPADVTDPFLPVHRNAMRAPSVAWYDLSILKRFNLTEAVRMNFETNLFNVFNRAALAAPSGNLTSALFGRVTRTLPGTNPRQIQFGLKVAF